MRATLPAVLLLLVVAVTASVAQSAGGLPQRAPEPRTMREFWPVFLVLSLVWLGVMAAALRLGAPYGRIAERIRRLEEKSSRRET